jgi:hypothetical protein
MAIAVTSISAFATSAPTAFLTSSNSSTVTFAEYTGTRVGSDDILTSYNENRTVFWMAEKNDSYLLIFDPINSGNVRGKIIFDRAISAVFDTKNELIGSSRYQKSDVVYDWKNASGLEGTDSGTVSGNIFTLDWRASSPGDYVRVVLAPVPEPATSAMFLAGLGLMGFIARRRRNG